MAFRWVVSTPRHLVWLALNLRWAYGSSQLQELRDVEQIGITLRWLSRARVADVLRMYAVNSGAELDLPRTLLLRVAGRRLCVVAIDTQNDDLVGMEFFYRNFRDFRERTIHEAYIAVSPEYRGRGLATAMRRSTIAHFASSRLSGVSTRISASNTASLKSALAAGFLPVQDSEGASWEQDPLYLVRRW